MEVINCWISFEFRNLNITAWQDSSQFLFQGCSMRQKFFLINHKLAFVEISHFWSQKKSFHHGRQKLFLSNHFYSVCCSLYLSDRSFIVSWFSLGKMLCVKDLHNFEMRNKCEKAFIYHAGIFSLLSKVSITSEILIRNLGLKSGPVSEMKLFALYLNTCLFD